MRAGWGEVIEAHDVAWHMSGLPAELEGLPIPEWAAWLAQDEDGTWWAYEAEPNQQHNGWYENEVGRLQWLAKGAVPMDWRMCLIRVAQGAASSL